MSRILIVDDEPMIAMLLADWVSELGHEAVGPTHNTHAALAMIANSTPDAAIVDVSLGEGSGYPVAECLAKRNIPFVFATGHAQQSLAACFASTPVLVKPFDFADDHAAIDTMIARAASFPS